MTKDIKFSPQYQIEEKKSCLISVAEQKLELIHILAQKDFSNTELQSFKTAEILSTITITNYSSLPINHLLFFEFLPIDFSVEKIPDISLELNDHSLKLSDFQKNAKYIDPKEEIKEIYDTLHDYENTIETMNQNQNKIISDMDALNVESLKKEKLGLIEKSKQISKDIQNF